MSGIDDNDPLNSDGTEDSENSRTGQGSKKGGRKGSGDASGLRLPAKVLSEVMKDWEYLDVNKVVMRLAEFFGEGIARASANLSVDWASLTKGGHAIMHQFIICGNDFAQFLRERTRDSMVRLQRKYGVRFVNKNTAKPSPAGF